MNDYLAGLRLLEVVRLVGIVVAAMLVLTLLAVAVRRLSGGRQQRRQDQLSRTMRPLLLDVLAEDEPDPATMQHLVELPRAEWRAAEIMLITMLGKVRGGSRDALIEALAARGALTRAARQTRSRSMIVRCRAAELLGAARREEFVPVLVSLLADPKPDVRRVAIRSLGRIGSPAAARPLLESVSGERRTSPVDVSSALVLLGPRATDVLAQVAADSDSSTEQLVAAEVLGLRGAVVACRTLISLLDDSDSVEVRIRAARALGRIGSPVAGKPLTRALASPVVELRVVAARALGQLGATAAVSPLVEHLGDDDHRVAANAAEALGRLGDAGRTALLGCSTGDVGRSAGHAREALALLELAGNGTCRA